MDIAKKRRQDQALIAAMIALYCRKQHRQPQLCPDCKALTEYAQARLERCPHMATKTFCSSCTTHCYAPEMREKIRTVMRFSGPRILFTHPLPALRHAWETLRNRGAKA